MPNRANGEGSVYNRKSDGKWIASVTVDGKRTVMYAPSSTDAKKKLKAALARIENDQPVKDATMTVAEWTKRWRTTTLAASPRKASTKELYRLLAIRHLEVDPFGMIRLDKLRPSDIDALVIALRGKKLADSTVRQIYTVLRAVLDGAVRDKHLSVNVAAKVQRPGIAWREARFLEPDEMTALLAAAKNSRFWPVLVLAANSGLRRGELLALRWDDLDLDTGELRVTGTLRRTDSKLSVTEPKTARSRRKIPLSPTVVAMLREHRRAQVAERLLAGSEWTDTGHVFVTEFGHLVEPRNLARAITTAATKAGLTKVGVHTLRHSFATALLRAGVDIKTVSELLGHSSIAITGDIYVHASSASSRAAVNVLAGAISF